MQSTGRLVLDEQLRTKKQPGPTTKSAFDSGTRAMSTVYRGASPFRRGVAVRSGSNCAFRHTVRGIHATLPTATGLSCPHHRAALSRPLHIPQTPDIPGPQIRPTICSRDLYKMTGEPQFNSSFGHTSFLSCFLSWHPPTSRAPSSSKT